MPDTLPNIILPSNEWVDLYALTGIAVGTQIKIQNIGYADVHLTVAPIQPGLGSENFCISSRRVGGYIYINAGASGVWAFSGTKGGKVNVSIHLQDITGLELAKGNVHGHTVGTIFGHNQDLDPANPAMVWDYGTVQPIEVLLPADTELFLSSSNALDTNSVVIIVGETDDYTAKTLIFTFTGGQSQQSIGLWFRVDKITVIDGVPLLGDLYCAEADTLTGGLPDTPAGVHAQMHINTGTTHKASGTVLAGHTMMINRLFLGTRRGEDCVYDFMVRSGNMPDFIEASGFPVYQGTIFETFDPPFPITERTDFYFRGTTVTNSTQVYANIGYTLVDNSVIT